MASYHIIAWKNVPAMVEARDASETVTRQLSDRFQQLIESRDAQFGALAGVAFAEGVVVRTPVVREDLFKAR